MLRIRMSGRGYYLTEIILAILTTIALGFIPVLNMLIPLVWIGCGIAILITYLYVRNHWIELGDDGINVSKGIINLKTVFIPYANVDNIGLETKLLDRIIGLTQISIDTKGRADVEVVLKKVPINTAEEAVKIVKSKMK